jgi:hypothetical protein
MPIGAVAMVSVFSGTFLSVNAILVGPVIIALTRYKARLPPGIERHLHPLCAFCILLMKKFRYLMQKDLDDRSGNRDTSPESNKGYTQLNAFDYSVYKLTAKVPPGASDCPPPSSEISAPYRSHARLLPDLRYLCIWVELGHHLVGGCRLLYKEAGISFQGIGARLLNSFAQGKLYNGSDTRSCDPGASIRWVNMSDNSECTVYNVHEEMTVMMRVIATALPEAGAGISVGMIHVCCPFRAVDCALSSASTCRAGGER